MRVRFKQRHRRGGMRLKVAADVRTEILFLELNLLRTRHRLLQSLGLVGTVRADRNDTSARSYEFTILHGFP